jgi:hypothetical protein
MHIMLKVVYQNITVRHIFNRYSLKGIVRGLQIQYFLLSIYVQHGGIRRPMQSRLWCKDDFALVS